MARPAISNPLTMCSIVSLCSGMEEILRFYPQHINQKKDDGFTTFHIAATNDQAAVFTYMASFVSAIIIIVTHMHTYV